MASVTEFTIRNYYTRDIPIDDGVDGDEVARGSTLPIRVRRFSVDQLKVFQAGFARVNNPTAERFIYRKPDGDEQVKQLDPRGRSVYVISDDEIRRRREAEMSAEERAAYQAAGLADDEHMVRFCSDAIANHVWLAPGAVLKLIDDQDQETRVTDGVGLVQAFGGNLSMLVRLTRVIHQENTLSPEEKKAWRSRFDSTPSSPTPAGGAASDGARPAATASSVGREGSVSSGDALAAPSSSPSGSTVT